MRSKKYAAAKKSMTILLSAVLSLNPVVTALAETDSLPAVTAETNAGEETPVETEAQEKAETQEAAESKAEENGGSGLDEQKEDGASETDPENTESRADAEGETAESAENGAQEAADGETAGTEAEAAEEIAEDSTVRKEELKTALNDTVNQNSAAIKELVQDDEAAFQASRTVNGIIVTVTAYDEGIVPENTRLRVTEVKDSSDDGADIENAVEVSREEDANVFATHMLDIKLIGADGEEIEPDGEVEVTFTLASGDMPANMAASVYHLAENPDYDAEAAEAAKRAEAEEAEAEEVTEAAEAAEAAEEAKAADAEEKENTEAAEVDTSETDPDELKASDFTEDELLDIIDKNPDADYLQLRNALRDLKAEKEGTASEEELIVSEQELIEAEEAEEAEAAAENPHFEAQKLDIAVDQILLEDADTSELKALKMSTKTATPSNYEETAEGDESGDETGDSDEGSDTASAAADTEDSAKLTSITFTTESFSYYVVEFTFEEKEFVLEGDSDIRLSELLEALELTDYETIDAVEVSNESLFKAEKRRDEESGEEDWYITTVNPFITTEWMHVTLDGDRYDITVTDDAKYMTLTENTETSTICTSINDNRTIDLNGYVLKRGITDPDNPYYASDSVVNRGTMCLVQNSAKLTIISSNTERPHAGTLRGSNSRGKVWFNDGTGPEIIKGGIITGSGSDSKAQGGAITMDGDCELVLENVTIAGNISDNSIWAANSGFGGGIHAGGVCTITMKNSRICYNYAENGGGGVSLGGQCVLNMDGTSSIDHNYTEINGGGICTTNNLNLKGDSIKGGNISNNCAGNSGGGIFLCDLEYNIENVKITDNYAGANGGAVKALEDTRIYGCTITGNEADKGGGIFAGDIKLEKTTVTGNRARTMGGGVYAATWIYPDGKSFVEVELGGKLVVKDNYANGATIMADEEQRADRYNKTADFYLDNQAFINKSPSSDSEIWIAADRNRRITTLPGAYQTNAFNTNEKIGYVYWDTEDESDTYRHVIISDQSQDKYKVNKITLTPGKAQDLNGSETITEDERGTAPVIWNYEKFTVNDINADRNMPSYAVFEKDYDILNGITRSECDTDTMYQYFYSDGYFFTDPRRYNTHLATMSLIMEKTAFNANTGSDSEGNKIGYLNKFRAAKQILSDIGCDDEDIFISDSYTVQPTDETIGYAIGRKALQYKSEYYGYQDSGYILVPVLVRGGGYGLEWMSNVTLGSSGEAEGFADAADQVFEGVKKYVKENDLTDAVLKGKVRFWVVGYSRGGATANLTAKRLIDYYRYGKTEDSNEEIINNVCNAVYGYTFEAPQGGVASEEYDGADYSSIHNIQNFSDVVTYVAPIDMGFKRYGVDHYVPGDDYADESIDAYNGYLRAYAGSLTGVDDISGKAAGAVYRRDNDYWDTDNEHYRNQKKLMRQQLATMEPGRVFDDYFAEARLQEIQAKVFGFDLTEETGDHYSMGLWLADFLHYFQYWGVGVYNKHEVSARSNYVNLGYQAAFRTLMKFKETASDKQKDNITGRIGGGFIAKFIWNLRKQDSAESAYDICKEYKIIAEDALDLTYDEFRPLYYMLLSIYCADTLRSSSAAFNYGKGIAANYYDKNISSLLLGTLVHNISNIGSNHSPEVNLAWLRSYDSYYADGMTDNWGSEISKTCYYVKKAAKEAVKLPAITATAYYNDSTVTAAVNLTQESDGIGYEIVRTTTYTSGQKVVKRETGTASDGKLEDWIMFPGGMKDNKLYIQMKPAEGNEGGAVYYYDHALDDILPGKRTVFDLSQTTDETEPSWELVRRPLTIVTDDSAQLAFETYSVYSMWYDTASAKVTLTFDIDSRTGSLMGEAFLTGDTVYGETLTVDDRNVTEKDSSGTPAARSYTWSRWTKNSDDTYTEEIIRDDEGNAYSETSYKLTAADVGKYITCRVIAEGYPDTVETAKYGPVKPITQTAPTPELDSKTDSSFTVIIVQNCQYQVLDVNDKSKLKESGWKSDGEFKGLENGKLYYVFARKTGLIEKVTDSAGKTSYVTVKDASEPSDPLEVCLTGRIAGTASIEGDAVYSETLKAVPDIANTEALKLKYQWLRDGKAISGAVSATYDIVKEDVGTCLSCSISAESIPGSVVSTATSKVKKATQIPPSAPTLVSSTGYSLTIANADGNEYTIDGGASWYSGDGSTCTFSGLVPGRNYTIYARKAETDCYFASRMSSALRAQTGEADALKGTVIIDAADDFVYGELLTLNFRKEDGSAGLNNTGELRYQWYRSDTKDGERTEISDETYRTYTITKEDVGKYISCVVTCRVETGSLEATTPVIGKAAQTAPSMPELKEKTDTGISVKTKSGIEYQLLESSDPAGLKENGWTTEGSFSRLDTVSKAYYVFARKAETEVYSASAASSPLFVGLSGLQGKAVLGSRVSGQSLYSVSVYGKTLQATVTVEDPDNELSGTKLTCTWKRNGKAVGTPEEITLNGLTGVSTRQLQAEDVGAYISCEFTSAAKKGSIESDTSYAIRKISQSKPAAPELASAQNNPGTDSITIKALAGMQYSIDGGNSWYPSKVNTSDATYTFNGLKPDTEYYVYAKKAETAYQYASIMSDALIVSTDLEHGLRLSGLQEVGEKVEAFVSGKIAQDEVVYSWYRVTGSDIDTAKLISGASESTYTLTAEDCDREILCIVRNAKGTRVLKAMTGTIAAAQQKAPAAPKTVTENETLMIDVENGLEYELNLPGTDTWLRISDNSGENIDIFGYIEKVLGSEYAKLTTCNIRAVAPAKQGYMESCSESVSVKKVLKTLTGTVSISGTEKYGEKLTATVSDANAAVSDLSFQWYRSGKKIVGAQAADYQLTKADIGSTLSCVVSCELMTGTISSGDTGVIKKGDQNPPAAPVLKSKDGYSITINSTDGYQYDIINNGKVTVYTADGTELTFRGLTPDTEYQIVAILPETDCLNASTASEVLKVTTDAAAALTGTLTFASENYVYGETLTCQLSGSNNTGTLSYQWYRSETPGGTKTAISGQIARTHNNTAEDIGKYLTCVVESSVETGSIAVTTSAAIEKMEQAAPSMPELKEKTDTAVSVETAAGVEYQILESSDPSGLDEGSWVSSGSFTGIDTLNKSYRIFARKAETEICRASSASAALYVGADGIHGSAVLESNEAGKTLYSACVVGQTLKAEVTVTDRELSGTKLSCSWKRNGTAIGSAQEVTLDGLSGSGTYVLTADDIGAFISCEFTSSLKKGSLATAGSSKIRKMSQEAPETPALADELNNPGRESITIRAAAGTEYTIDGGLSWVSTADTTYTFTGLTPDTEYEIRARRAETATAYASAMSETLTVSTDLAYGLRLSGDQKVDSTIEAFVNGKLAQDTVLYSWYRLTGSDISTAELISGATADTYSPAPEDSGHELMCVAQNQTGTRILKAITGTIANAVRETPDVPSVTEKGNTVKIDVEDGMEYEINIPGTDTWELIADTSMDLFAYLATLVPIYTGDTLSIRTQAPAKTGYDSSVSAALSVKKPIAILQGTVKILGNAVYGETLTADYTDGNNSGELSYQWYRNGKAITGAVESTYTLTTADVGSELYCTVMSSVEKGELKSASTDAVAKAERQAPEVPVLKAKTQMSEDTDCTITIEAVPGCVYKLNDGIEIDPDGDAYVTFEGLSSSETCNIKAYYKATAEYRASAYSQPLTVVTDEMDCSALKALIAEAEELQKKVLVSADGTDVYTTDQWTTADERNDLMTPLGLAEELVLKAQADWATLKAMTADMREALSDFRAAIRNGSRQKEEPVPDKKVPSRNGSGSSGSSGSSGKHGYVFGTTSVTGIVNGNWRFEENGKWILISPDGRQYRDEWVYAYNPYAKTDMNQAKSAWFHFDRDGFMQVGFFTDLDGQVYYLNENSDNTLGAMLSGWRMIGDSWYYFTPFAGGEYSYGALQKDRNR